MFRCLPIGSRKTIYLPSCEAYSFQSSITSRAFESDGTPPPPRPPLPAENGVKMPRVSRTLSH